MAIYYCLGEISCSICSVSIQKEAKVHGNVLHGKQGLHYIAPAFGVKNYAKTLNSFKDANP